MSLLTLDVGFEGRCEILRLDFSTNWLNLEAVVKCFLDVGEICIQYFDDENEEICLNSEEELLEAKRIAYKENGVLRLKVTRKQSDMNPAPTNNETGLTLPLGRLGPMMHRTNPDLPVQCSSRPTSNSRMDLGKKHGLTPVAAAASKLQADNQRPAAEISPAPLILAEEPLFKAGPAATVQEGQAQEAAIPEELVQRVVRCVLHNLDGTVLNWLSNRASPTPPMDQSDSVKPPPKVFCHFGIFCDCCNKAIVGVRYKCGHCVDYDLCEECEAKAGVHIPSHVFLKLRQPAHKGLGFKPDGKKVALLKRPIYYDDSAATDSLGLKRREQKMARRAALAELKRKYSEEKRRAQQEARPSMTPTKRERLERMAEKQVEEILHAAHVMGGPEVAASDEVAEVSTANPAGQAENDTPEETTKLLMRWNMDATFVQDGNLPDDSCMQPGTKFVKQWIMKNSGPLAWNQDTKLKFLWGNMFASSPDVAEVPHLGPGEEGCICVEFVAPCQPGQYQSHWRLSHEGEQFGHRVWCNITVDQPADTTKKVEDASQEASSNAVAQLQTNQQDPSIPMRVCSSTEMLTAQDVLSFEMLKISEGQQAEVEMETEVATLTHQPTRTPHNTPLGVTPCISPVRELDANVLSRHMSEHGEVQIVEMPAEEEVEPITGVDEADLRTDCAIQEQDDDTETVSSSEDLLDDFEVVPLPDCFDPSKPLNVSVQGGGSSVTSTQTFLTLLEPMPVISKQDAGVSAVTVCNTVGTNALALATTAHSECQTSPSEQRDAASSANPSSMTVGTDVEALCSTATSQAQTDSLANAEDFIQVASAEVQTMSLAGARCVGTSAGSFLHVASSVTQTESCLSQDATTATAKPVTVAAATSVDGLFSTAHTEAQTVSCTLQDAVVHARPSVTAVATDVDALLSRAHAGAQTVPAVARDATTATGTLATSVDALASESPAAVYDTATPISSTTANVDKLFNASGAEFHSEPLVPHQLQSPLQIVRIADPSATLDADCALATYRPDDQVLDQPPKIVDVTGQLGTDVDQPSDNSQRVCIERDQEVFHDALEPIGAGSSDSQETSATAEPNQAIETSDSEQDPMEALGYTAQKAMEFAGGFVKHAFDHAAMSVNALLNPQPLPQQEPWPKPGSETADPVDRLVEMGFGNRQHNRELLHKHKNDVSLCVQELLQEQDDAWHAARH